MEELSLVEVNSAPLPEGKIGRRSREMLLSRFSGRSDSQIAARYGVPVEMVNEMINDAIQDILETRQHVVVQREVLSRLIETDMQLRELYDGLPTNEIRWHEELDHTERPSLTDRKPSKIVRLSEQVCNVPLKVKILAERRQNALATKVILGADPGDTGRDDRERDVSDIIRAVQSSAREFAKEMSRELSTKAEEVGRLKASTTVNIKAEDVKDDVKAED